MENDWITVSEAAEIMGDWPATIRKMGLRGEITTKAVNFSIGRSRYRWLYLRSDCIKPPHPTDDPDVITREEAAAILGISVYGLRARMLTGCLNPIGKVSPGCDKVRRWHYSRAECERLREEWQPKSRKVNPYDKSPSLHDCIYLAAFVDGEGCIHIRTCRLKGKVTQHQVAMTATNTHLGVIEWIKDTFGGHFAIKHHAGHWRECYMWHVSAQEAHHVLKLIEPHLKVKRQQAQIALEFQEHLTAFRANRWHPAREEELEWREKQKNRISLLNRPQQPIEP